MSSFSSPLKSRNSNAKSPRLSSMWASPPTTANKTPQQRRTPVIPSPVPNTSKENAHPAAEDGAAAKDAAAASPANNMVSTNKHTKEEPTKEEPTVVEAGTAARPVDVVVGGGAAEAAANAATAGFVADVGTETPKPVDVNDKLMKELWEANKGTWEYIEAAAESATPPVNSKAINNLSQTMVYQNQKISSLETELKTGGERIAEARGAA